MVGGGIVLTTSVVVAKHLIGLDQTIELLQLRWAEDGALLVGVQRESHAMVGAPNVRCTLFEALLAEAFIVRYACRAALSELVNLLAAGQHGGNVAEVARIANETACEALRMSLVDVAKNAPLRRYEREVLLQQSRLARVHGARVLGVLPCFVAANMARFGCAIGRSRGTIASSIVWGRTCMPLFVEQTLMPNV